MKEKIEKLEAREFPELVNVWEASVRATHHFLNEEDIEFFKPLILNEYLKALELRGIRNDRGGIVGFIGIAEQKIEMLFIHPDARGKGIGQKLLKYALQELIATKVDVNEENQQAVGFYEHLGFKTVNRSDIDPSGKPYPILHMELK